MEKKKERVGGKKRKKQSKPLTLGLNKNGIITTQNHSRRWISLAFSSELWYEEMGARLRRSLCTVNQSVRQYQSTYLRIHGLFMMGIM